MSDPVKGKTAAGHRREQRARQTRTRITDAAMRLFVERGFLATTVDAIAAEAGVASATVYQAFGTKQRVLESALDTTIAGDSSPAPLLDREWVVDARSHRNPRARLEAVVLHAAQIAARTAPVKQVMRDAAATDRRVKRLIAEDHERRRRTQRALVEFAVGDEELRPGMTIDRAADSFFMLVNSHGHELATEALGWSDSDWQRWLVEVLTDQLFGGGGGSSG
jgi:AcrR family transcriptional regulator